MTSMFLKEALLLLAGLAAGSTVAAGVYAFLVVIGVYPRRQSCGRRQQKAVAERELVLDFW